MAFPDVGVLAGELARVPRAVVLIDGPSGSGKSLLASRLVAAWPGTVQLVSLDALYPGWDGLATGSTLVASAVLAPVPGYRAWDWTDGSPGAWVALDARLPLVIEGCGTLTPENRALATYGIWVDAPAAVRHARAMARDEGAFARHWDDWATQEDEHRRVNLPDRLADLRVTTA